MYLKSKLIYDYVKTFNPEFMKWNFLSLNLDMSIAALGCHSKIKTRITNSIDLDETSRYCLQKYIVCLCRGFTAQSTLWGHVERGQFT